MIIKLEKYQDIKELRDNLKNEFVVNLEECDLKAKERIIDFLTGLVFLKGSLKKINKNEYKVIIEL